MHSSVVTYIPRNFSNINPLCGNFFCNFPWPMKPVMHWPFVSVIWNHTVISIKAGIESPAITLTQFILWKQKMLSVLANLWKSRPKLFTWDTLMLCYSIQPSNKDGCNDASGNTRHTREGSADHFTRLVVLKDESNPGEPLCCWEGKFLWGIRTSRWLSVCISFTRAVLSCITGITWSESRPQARDRPGGQQSLHPTRPPPMCSGLHAKPQRQASSLAQLERPRTARFAIIISGHLI